MKFDNNLIELVRTDLAIGQVPALMGEPGTGKSSFFETLADLRGDKIFVVACNQLADKADLTGGRLVPNPNSTGPENAYMQVFFPHVEIQAAVDWANEHPDENPILFLDEINRANSDITSAVLTLVTMRKLGLAKLPPNLQIAIAGNIKGNVTALDSASLSRFTIYEVSPDAGTLIQILGDEMNPHVRKVLTEHPEYIYEASKPRHIVADMGGDPADPNDPNANTTFAELTDSEEQMLQLTTPRTIEAVSKWLNATPTDKLQEYLTTSSELEGTDDWTLLKEILVAYAGDTSFTTALIGEIAAGLSNQANGNQAISIAPSRPQVYSNLRAASTIDQIAAIISGLDEDTKGDCLVYALYSNDDETVILNQLAAYDTQLSKDHRQTLVKLAGNQKLNDANISALTSAGGEAAGVVDQMIGFFA